MLKGFSLGSYLLLVDYTSRLCRKGKARMSREVASILDRLGSSGSTWAYRIQKLFSETRLLGSYAAGGLKYPLPTVATLARAWKMGIARALASVATGRGISATAYFTTERKRLRALAEHRGVHHLDNLASLPA